MIYCAKMAHFINISRALLVSPWAMYHLGDSGMNGTKINTRIAGSPCKAIGSRQFMLEPFVRKASPYSTQVEITSARHKFAMIEYDLVALLVPRKKHA